MTEASSTTGDPDDSVGGPSHGAAPAGPVPGASSARGPGIGAVAGAVLGVFLVSLASLAAFGWLHELPVPRVHDEFAYLLTADTFAEGRLTNPTHPLWVHFDSFHVFHEPTYQAKYPPGQGAFLALGQVLGGHPAWGLWLGTASALAALAWMLAALVPVRWAVIGTLLLLANAFVFTKWGESYWGGGVALLGGALYGGGLLRCLRAPTARDASLAGLGLFLLANTRPAEGALVCLVTLPAWLACLRAPVGSGAPGSPSVSGAYPRRRILLPLGLAVALTLGFTALYNHALTGDALLLPYAHWDKYDSPHEAIQHYAGSADPGPAYKLRRLARFYFGPVFVWVLPLLLWRPSRRVLGAGLVAAVVVGASVLGSRAWPHYVAPAAPWVVLLTVQALRRLSSWRIGGAPAGKVLVLLAAAWHVGISAGDVARAVRQARPSAWHRERQAIGERLAAAGGRHLILVRYGPEHLVHEEWVYNAADIEAAPVVWARDLGGEENRALLDHFARRTLWRLEPEQGEMKLRPLETVDGTDEERRDG